MSRLKIAMAALLLELGMSAAAMGGARELTLQEAVSRTLERSPDLSAARRARDLAALEEPRYLSVTDPVLTAGAAYGKDRTPPVIPFQGDRNERLDWEVGLQQTWITGTEASLGWLSNRTDSNAARFLNPAISSSLTLAIRQALLRDFWGRPDRMIRARAKAGLRAAEADVARLEDALAAQAGRDYWALSAGQKILRVEEAGLADARRLLAKQQEKRRYGTALDADVLQAEAFVAGYEADLVVARAAVRQIQYRLLETMGEIDHAPMEGDVVTVSTFVPTLPESAFSAWLDRALRQRPDLAAARDRVEALTQGVSIASLSVLPQLDLTGQLGWAGLEDRSVPSYEDTFSGDHPVFGIGFDFSIPLQFKRAKIDRQEAEFRLAAEQAALERLRLRVQREVRSAWEDWQAARQKAVAFDRLLSAQRAKLEEERREAARGRSSTDQLIRFSDDARAAERRQVRSLEELALAELTLRLASGERLGTLP